MPEECAEYDRVIPRATCPYCNRGPLPAKTGPNLCAGCSKYFHV